MDLALETIRVLRRFKNAVLEGPPGTGKSHVVDAVAAGWEAQTSRPLGGNGRGRYAITLHPSTTYEEFVEGLRYDETKSMFVRRDGFLREVISDAISNPGADYLVLIDELNRANVPKVFGDLLLTMEASKRSSWNGTKWAGGMEVTLPYSGKLFSVPDNVYLLGTMNTSDRSIAPIDSALRRRFGFVRVEPLAGEALRAKLIETDGAEAAERLARSIDQLTNLNEALRRSLGPSAMLGHSYVFGVDPTGGAVADANDPLAVVRETVSASAATGVFWVEARKLDGGSHNQLNLPDIEPGTGRKGIVDAFFPLSSGGSTTTQRSPRGTHDKVEILFAGKRYVDNVVRFNPAGPNYKIYYQGTTAIGEKFSTIGASLLLDHKVHVWLRRNDNTLELLLLDRSPAVLAALEGVSVAPDGWHEHTRNPNGRSYGVVDLASLAATGTTQRSADEDAEWMIWRYAILPQLLDTATQVGATELLTTRTRNAWLETANASDLADRWATFDAFLSSLSLTIEEEGHGLTRGLTVSEVPSSPAPDSTDAPEPTGTTPVTNEDDPYATDDE
ncbi:McrB family protein [Curtobacterium pusillum]|uniref:AAA domain-containing protein n=1 Tax=Curtobacterium pusillum TaxID=69373 RepID=A0ABX2MBJ9_9MICO|nr:AAA family ATPase [Curtobacterium pusillum]NUU13132.1 AAA domain-containing protein [Curtobacterium pusillum]